MDHVITAIGTLPSCHRQSVIFFANLDCIFFGDQQKTRQIIRNVKGFHGYGSRLLPILDLLFHGENNLLALQERPDADLCAYFSRGLGLRLPEIVLLAIPPGCAFGDLQIPEGGLDRIRHHPASLIDGYVTDPLLERLAAATGKRLVNTHAVCRRANDKLYLHQFLIEQGLPVFDGRRATMGPDLAAALAALRIGGYARAVVRAGLGASGFGMQIVDLHGADRFPEELFGDDPVLVQGWIEENVLGCGRVESPSVQFFCGDVCLLYDLTDQLLSHSSVHEGNMAPPEGLAADPEVRREILRQARRVAGWIGGLGYRGPGSIDFLVFEKGDRVRVVVCEVNARVTGATYPSLLALHSNPGGAWLMRNMVFAPCMGAAEFLEFLARQDMLWEGGCSHGIVPVNIICNHGRQIVKCQLLSLAPTPGDCRLLLDTFSRLLPARCRFDRD